jgi:hypothetical protein
MQKGQIKFNKMKINKKIQWMAQCEAAINAQFPETKGKIDWVTLTYLYNCGNNEKEAVRIYCAPLVDSQCILDASGALGAKI